MDLTTTARYRVLGYPHEPTQLVLVACDEPDESLQDADSDGNLHAVDTDINTHTHTHSTVVSDGDDCNVEDTPQRQDNSPSINQFEPVYIDMTKHDPSIQSKIETLEAGYLIEATLKWTVDGPQLTGVNVIAETDFTFYQNVTGVFEAATATWNDAVAEGEGMGSRLTRGTDAKPNGALYVFAKQHGARNLIREFQTGITPLEPLIRRIDEEETASTSVSPESTQPRAVFCLNRQPNRSSSCMWCSVVMVCLLAPSVQHMEKIPTAGQIITMRVTPVMNPGAFPLVHFNLIDNSCWCCDPLLSLFEMEGRSTTQLN